MDFSEASHVDFNIDFSNILEVRPQRSPALLMILGGSVEHCLKEL